MNTQFEIASYEIALSRERKDFEGRGRLESGMAWESRLILRSSDRERKHAYVYFLPEEVKLPENRFPRVDETVVFLHTDRFSEWIDVLRNEKPLHFFAELEKPKSTSLLSRPEPVGEEEGCCESTGMKPKPDSSVPSQPAKPRDWRPFLPDASGSVSDATLVNAYLMSLASFHVYADEAAEETFQDFFRSKFEPWLEAGSGTPPRIEFFDNGSGLPTTGLQAAVMTNSEFTMVVFRGSEAEPTDWVNNAGFTPVPVDPFNPLLGLAHGGWTLELAAGFDTLHKLVHDMSDGFRKPVWVTGHSAGGALSTIFAHRLSGLQMEVKGVGTFGAPAMADPGFLLKYSNSGLGVRTQRWVNQTDLGSWAILPMILPFSLPPFPPYLHPTLTYELLPKESEVQIDANGGISLGPVEPVVYANSLPFPPASLNVKDHEMARYCNKLFLQLDQSTQDCVPLPPNIPG